MKERIRFGIVGAGWRAHFYLRVAHACPDKFEIVGIIDQASQVAREVAGNFGIKAFGSIEEMASSAKPQFVVTCIPRTQIPNVTKELVAMNVPALLETPPAETVEEMVELCKLATDGARIQVAEQYWLQPHQAARLAFAQSGRIGKVSQATISAAHGYHGISLMRRFLGVDFENAKITAIEFQESLVMGAGREGPPKKEEMNTSLRHIFIFEFGDRLGIIDFSSWEQYFSWFRKQTLLVRGERGEIVNETATYLKDYLTPINVNFHRHSAGLEGNLEGNYLKGIQAADQWFYCNPLAPAALSDDEIAVGTCLLKMAEYLETGKDFYSIAQACQDQYLTLMCEQALAKKQPVTTEEQLWSKV